MRHKNICCILFSLLISSQVLAQDGWDKYKPRTLKEITTVLAEDSLRNPDVLFTDEKRGFSVVLSANTFRSQVQVVYTGEFQKVPNKKKEVIAMWLKTYGKPKEYLDLFDTEYLFKEGSVAHWLPVQKQVASYFKEELQPNSKVILYVAWVGARKELKSVDHVFLVNEFEKQ